tara:strand:- start:373 stop:1035 length:663 start_codon:yes stop_codon:yes gene_type:complete
LNYETKSLFYNEFLYKLVIKNHLACIFRDKNLNNARNELDRMQTQLDDGAVIVRTIGSKNTFVTPDDFNTAKIALSLFSSFKHEDYKLRIEGASMSIYTNSISIIDKLSSRICIAEYWQPNKKHLCKLDKNVILVEHATGFEYRVTLNHRCIDQNFYNWIQKNNSKVKIGRIALEAVEKGFAPGLYFYTRDEKVLQLISLLIGHNFQTVQRIVSTQDLDK